MKIAVLILLLSVQSTLSAFDGFQTTKPPPSTTPPPPPPTPSRPEPTRPETTPLEPTQPTRPPPTPNRPEPTQPEPTRPTGPPPTPTRPEPTQPEPTRPVPTRPTGPPPTSTRPEPTRPEPTQPEPTRPEPTRPTGPPPTPTRPEPTRPEPTGLPTIRPRPTGPFPTGAPPSELPPPPFRGVNIFDVHDLYPSNEVQLVYTPGFPYRFSGDYLDCQMRIHSQNKCVKLQSLAFDLEYNFDFLHLYLNGMNIESFTGTRHVVFESGDAANIDIRYQTDVNIGSVGFVLAVLFEECSREPLVCECGSCDLIGREATVTSSNFPNNYEIYENCTVPMRPREYMCPHIDFELVDVERGYDFVSVFVDGVGEEVQNGNDLRFSGGPGSRMSLRFTSDNSNENQGFKADLYYDFCHVDEPYPSEPPPLPVDCGSLEHYWRMINYMVGEINILLHRFQEIMDRNGGQRFSSPPPV